MNKEQFEYIKSLNNYDEFMANIYKSLNITNPESVKEFVPKILETVLQNKEKAPLAMFDHVYEVLKEVWTASENLPYNAGWFHGLVPAVLMNALKNNGYDVTERDVKEAFMRGLKMPPGGCGFCGVCGATAGVGIVVSIVLKATPFHSEEKTESFEASLNAAEKLKEIGGVRCCRLSSYVAIKETIQILKKFNYQLPDGKMDGCCPINNVNDECNGSICPFCPKDN